MKDYSKKDLEHLKKYFAVGSTVKLIYMDDAKAPKEGTLGEIIQVDDIGTIHIKWANGSKLGAIYGIDIIEKVYQNGK